VRICKAEPSVAHRTIVVELKSATAAALSLLQSPSIYLTGNHHDEVVSCCYPVQSRLLGGADRYERNSIIYWNESFL